MSSPDDTSPLALDDRPALGRDEPRPHAPRGGGGELLRLLGLAAIPTAVYFVLVLRNLTYAWDDFIQFGVTLQTGLSTDLLTYSLFEHFAPLNRAVHGLLVTYGGLDPRWAIAVALPIFFSYCLALADLARVLGASWARTALALAVATVTPSTAFVGAFLDPYFHVMIPVAATAAATAAYVRWVRNGRFVHLATGSAAVILACAVQERGIFIVLFLALARVLVIEGGAPVRRWIPTLVRDWPFLLVPALMAAGTAAVVALFFAADAERGSVLGTISLVVQAWTLRLVPMITGTYEYGSGAGEVALAAMVNMLALAVLVVAVLRNRWNVRPGLLLVVWFVFNFTFIGFGRLGIAPLETFRDDPNYYTYALPAVVILIASLRPDPRRADTPVPPEARRRTNLLQVGAAVLLFTLVVISSLPQAERHQVLRPEYLETSVSDVREANEGGPTAVAPTLMPGGLVPGPFFPYNGGEFLLRAIDDRTIVDVDPENPLFLDATGALTTGSAHLLAREEASSPVAGWTESDGAQRIDGEGYCISSGEGGHLVVPLSTPAESPGGAAWVRLIAEGESTYGSIAGYGDDGWVQSAPSPLDEGHGSVSFMVPTAHLTQVDVVGLRAERLCIEAVEVWALAAEGAEGCGWVGSGGEIVAPREDEPAPDCSRD